MRRFGLRPTILCFKTIFFLFVAFGLTVPINAQCEYDMGPITVTHGNGQITMSGPAADYHFQIFENTASQNQVFNCSYNSCGSSQTAYLSSGNYRVKVTSYNWQNTWESTLVLGVSPCDASNPCQETNGAITVDYGTDDITMSGPAADYHYQIFENTASQNQVFTCSYNSCGSSQTATNLSAGDYRIKVTNYNWSGFTELYVTLPCASNREYNVEEELDTYDENSISLFPNPTKDLLYVKIDDFAEKQGRMSIYNVLGQEVHQQLIGGDNMLEIDVSNYSKGMYYMLIKTENTSVTKQFVVVK